MDQSLNHYVLSPETPILTIGNSTIRNNAQEASENLQVAIFFIGPKEKEELKNDTNNSTENEMKICTLSIRNPISPEKKNV